MSLVFEPHHAALNHQGATEQREMMRSVELEFCLRYLPAFRTGRRTATFGIPGISGDLMKRRMTGTTPWAWIIRRAEGDEERFLIAFLHPHEGGAGQEWSCDDIARTEEEAREYAGRYGISPESFSRALRRVRKKHAAGSEAPTPPVFARAPNHRS